MRDQTGLTRDDLEVITTSIILQAISGGHNRYESVELPEVDTGSLDDKKMSDELPTLVMRGHMSQRTADLILKHYYSIRLKAPAWWHTNGLGRHLIKALYKHKAHLKEALEAAGAATAEDKYKSVSEQHREMLDNVKSAADTKRSTEAEVTDRTEDLTKALVVAYRAGANMGDLEAASGYSSPRIRQLLTAAGLKGAKGKRMS